MPELVIVMCVLLLSTAPFVAASVALMLSLYELMSPVLLIVMLAPTPFVPA
ncbi:hypothetical protein LGH82_25680 [Mesorhizobium sp. PAMC28654]|uniref:hypothetical protein n=1 Tax=Mesorhizobium sp. PAMC28654 TaxID=2880934 RepID=UPI001D0B687A|nr:hypothetical protein [Mesorhizobium sp. PAMC28654]UDL88487.1 hypothetical protein LGH82_25680 [Mesorhizobium sp. PAMC28654]